MRSKFLIIGSGIAGLTAATTIRALDKNAQICLINNEPYPPYKRTNLSKFIALGFQAEDFTLASEQDLRDLYKIELVYDTITQINYRECQAFGQVGQYDYEFLILATGARYELPKPLQHERVKYYHNKEETFAIINALGTTKKVAIIGAGVQGLETCYQMLKLGKQVSIVDPNSLPIANFRSPYISEWLKQDLAQRGVDCVWNTRIQEYQNSILEDFDLTICCFGTKPVSNLFPEKAVPQENLLFSNNVLACGDNTTYPDGERCTLWHEAMDMGQLAGRNAVALAAGQQLAKLQRKPYRCKIEIADRILFLAPPLGTTPVREKILEHQDSYYQFFLNESEQLVGASALCYDRDLLSPLQQAIWDSRPYSEVCEQLQIKS